MNTTLFKLTALAVAIGLSGCKADLESTDIQEGEKLTPNEILHKSSGSLFSRSQRVIEKGGNDEGSDNNVSEVTYYYVIDKATADSEHAALTYPVTGLSLGGQAPISVTFVQEVTNTCYDDTVIEYFDSYNECVAAGEYINDVGEVITISAEPTDVTGQGKFQYQLFETFSEDSNSNIGMNAPLSEQPGIFINGTEIRPTFTLSDQDWVKKFRAVLNVGGLEYEYVASTVARNPVIENVPDFLGRDVLNRRPGRTVQKIMTFSGFNTQAPVQIIKSTGDEYRVDYQIGRDGELIEYTGQPVSIRQGVEFSLFFTTPEDAYDVTYETQVIVGEITPALDEHGNPIKDDDTTTDNTQQDTLVLHNYASDYVPGATDQALFPPVKSVTSADSITVRGMSYINMDQAEFSTQEEINLTEVVLELVDSDGEPISGIDAIVLSGDDLVESPDDFRTVEIEGQEMVLKAYRWQTPVPLIQARNDYSIRSKTDLQGPKESISEPSYLTVDKLADIPFYPATSAVSYFKNLNDITVDNRTPENPILLMSDVSDLSGKGQGIVWKFPLTASGRLSCAANVASDIHGIQFNHQLPQIGGVFVAGRTWKLGHFDDSELNGNLTAIEPKISNSHVASRYPSHMAFDATGQLLYISNQSKWDFSLKDQKFVGSQLFKFPSDGAYSRSNGGHHVNNSSRGSWNGGVAKETNSTGDANKELNNGFSLDVYTIGRVDEEGNDQVEEFILSLDGKENGFQGGDQNRGNTGEVLLRSIQLPEGIENPDNVVMSSLDPEKTHIQITLVDADNGNAPIALHRANSIAVDDARGYAYIGVPESSDDNKADVIWKIDLAHIQDRSVREWPATQLASNEGLDAESPMLMGRISSFAMEGGLDYILATDKEQGGVFAIDPISGDRVWVFKTPRVEPASVCQ
ncbi:hypothetical protein [Echinimonas agarilytica]|uniref:Uncharacterized protein n=1 Tax=Echinimonas agarilytica TaxID=1215918 RepID=A0AA41W625_9GAMM|nr:hypothetical protein [Echinimonas agarilytica]MCM2679415.1 hypothetical protein [Echinimonas agarilytica]